MSRLTAIQLAVLRRMADGRLLYVPVNGVSHSTARSLVKRGLVIEIALSEYGDSAGAWGIKITDKGRLAAQAPCIEPRCELAFGHGGPHRISFVADTIGHQRIKLPKFGER